MAYLIAVGCGILGGGLLGFGWGVLAGILYSNLPVHQDGGPAMGGFFTMAPIGFCAGFLLTAGWMLSRSMPTSNIGKYGMFGSGFFFVIGMILFLLPIIGTSSAGPSSPLLTMEFDTPATITTDQVTWGYKGHDRNAPINWPLYESRLEGERRIYKASIKASDYPTERTGVIVISGTPHEFNIPLTGAVATPTEWSEWTERDGIRFRWRVTP